MCDEQQPIKKAKMTSETFAIMKGIEDTAIKKCAHWVKRKKRFCKMSVASDKEYCGEHEPAIKEDISCDGDRIPCPLDNKHTIYKRNLRSHLKICNARPSENQPEYIQKNINTGDVKDEEIQEELKNIKLNELEDEEFHRVIDKIKELYSKYMENKIEKLECRHKCLDEELAKEEYGKDSRKHLEQAAALLGILEKERKIENFTSFVEFGAGKGQLAFYLAKLLENKKNCQVILLDRMSLRHKKDNKIEDRSLVQRIRADIVDFCIDKLETLKGSQHCVAVSKHLCGGATDLTLRCITQARENVTDFIMISLCCHHRCDWRSFVGKEFLKEHQITQREFVIISKMASWAICGTGFSRERRRALEDRRFAQQEVVEINANPRLSLAERESVGFMCKRILDYARLDFLRQHGYEAELNYYVASEVTLENVVLLARKRE